MQVGGVIRSLAFVSLAFAAGCAGAAERASQQDYAKVHRSKRPTSVATSQPTSKTRVADDQRTKGADLNRFIAKAMDESPELRAAFERWKASVHRISQARKLPEPTISFGYFIQSVETRVGPQRAKVGLSQSFPWPTKLSAGADSAAAAARAEQNRVDALALLVQQRVSAAYWRLWLIRETRRIHREHLLVVRSLSESVLARVAIGAASLADQQQVDLTAARLEDMISGMDEAEITAIAQLHAAMGSQEPSMPTTSMTPPDAGVPAEDSESLIASAKEHPLILSFGQMAESKEQLARSQNASRYPSFSLGVDWIITGEARMPGVQDSGKDAVMLGAGMSVPLWQGIYSDGVEAAHDEASAQRSEQRAAADRAVAELEASLAAVRDAARRVNLYEHTLVPQADSAYASVLGAYASGRGTVAQTLLAQRDLLELKSDLVSARAEHAIAWARLENVVGRKVSALVVNHADVTRTTDGRK